MSHSPKAGFHPHLRRAGRLVALWALLAGPPPAVAQLTHEPDGFAADPMCQQFFLAGGAQGCTCEVAGRRAILACDVDGDGTPEHRTERRFDERGWLRSERVFLGGATEPSTCSSFRHDDEGRLLRERRDEGCDGTDESGARFEYGEDGRPLSERLDAGGVVQSTVRWEYDSAGRRTRVEYRYTAGDEYPDLNCRYDPPCSPPWDTCWQVEVCWEEARMEPVRLAEVDAVWLERLGHTPCATEPLCRAQPASCGCDASGRLVFAASDLDGDGLVDEWRTVEWYEGGARSERVDIRADGRVDVENHFDAAGRLIGAFWHEDDDGEADRGMTNLWEDPDRLLSTETFWGEALMSRTTYGYDDRGNRVVEERDEWADGRVDYRWTASYDAAGRLARVGWDCGADGTIDASGAYEVGEDGVARLAEGREDFSCAELDVVRSGEPAPVVDFPNRGLR